MNSRTTLLSLVMLPTALAAQQTPPPPPPPTNAAPPPPSMNGNRFMDNYNSRVLQSGRNPDAESYLTSQQVASCLSRRMKDNAGTLIDRTESDYAALKKALQNRYSLCMASSPSVALPYVNAALAEEMLRGKAGSLQDRSAASDAAAAKAYSSSQGGLTVDSLARCLAAYSPGLTYRVLASRAGTVEEGQAIANLYSQTPECGMRSRPTNVSTGEQRAMLATSLYGWVNRN